ncbi:hypothetical protein LX32DRAFT_203094 [Colletotrichum zoysiae]|uniref:Uncharacterized protein n=1 Tax=Colletotrichum zoysiae TaxID=1216348 RepID=A0AAD9LXV5_9PEZI|nr:hypothetical protein LX32DRAFT_203094 [Colletotrichum zoysiae]
MPSSISVLQPFQVSTALPTHDHKWRDRDRAVRDCPPQPQGRTFPSSRHPQTPSPSRRRRLEASLPR